jgi:hypothetical protein
MPSGGLLLRLGWKRAEEESSTEPAEGLRMFRVFVSCDDRLDPSSRVLLLSSVAVSSVAVALKALSRPHLR